MSKSVMIQGYSNNNVDLFLLTSRNHQQYCSKWGIDFHTMLMKYSPYPDFDLIRSLLSRYDHIVTIGSDCVFTNFNRNIFDVTNSDVALCEETKFPPFSYINGEIVWFNNNGNNRINDIIDIIQMKVKEGPHCKKDWGFQQICNENYKYWDFLKVVPVSERVQSPDDIISVKRWNGYNRWNKDNIVLHTLCGDNNDKYRRILTFANGPGKGLDLYLNI